jgi:hypothetical protein
MGKRLPQQLGPGEAVAEARLQRPHLVVAGRRAAPAPR